MTGYVGPGVHPTNSPETGLIGDDPSIFLGHLPTAAVVGQVVARKKTILFK